MPRGAREPLLTSVEFWADVVTEEERDAAAALLVQGDLERLRDRLLARAVETREEEDEALLGAGRVALTKSLDDSTVETSQTCLQMIAAKERTRS